MSAELQRLGALRVRRCERRDLATPRSGELHREMAEPADSDNAHVVCRGNVELQKGREHRDPAAHEWTGSRNVDVVGKFEGGGGVGPNKLAESSDIASGYFETGSLLELDGKWQKLSRIRILMGDEMTRRTKKALLEAVTAKVVMSLDASLESDKDENPFLNGVPPLSRL